jgi:general secretion pathway protein C
VHDNRRMVSRIAAFVTWAAVAACVVFWAMRLWAQPIAAPAQAIVVSTASGFNGDLKRVFGPDAPPAQAMAAVVVPADPRFRLIGVVAPRAPAANAQGLALIATDGKPPKAYRVGASIDGELVLLAVHARGASLGPRGQPAQVSLELPALPPPSTGTPSSAFANPLPRPAGPLPTRPATQPQAVPMPPVAAPTDNDETEAQPEPGNRPTQMPPPSASRPPT